MRVKFCPTSMTPTADEAFTDELVQTEEFAQGLPQGSLLAIILEGPPGAVRHGASATLLASDKELIPNQVAQLLWVSHPHLVKIMDHELLAYRLVGSSRWIAMADLPGYIERHERTNTHISQLLDTHTHVQLQAIDEAAPLVNEDLAALGALALE